MMKETTSANSGRTSALSLPVDRREFLKTMGILGGGILVCCTVGNALAQEGGRPGPRSLYPADWNVYLRIGADGKVTCFTGKIDMGQGTVTSLPQIVAEELGVAYDSVRVVMGDTDLCPWDMGTFGSMTIRLFGPALRKAAVEARGVLKALGAEKLGCPVKQVTARDGVVFDKARPDRKIAYGELAGGSIIERRLKEIPPETSPGDFKIMGRPYLHRDGRDKVTGRAKYTGDIRLPGMLYAAVLRPPAHGAKLKSVDLSDARQVEGAAVVQDGDLTAVVHPLPDQARKALEKIKAVYEAPSGGSDNDTIFDHLLSVTPQGRVVSRGGDIQEGRKLAKHIFEETYKVGYLAHAPMETHTTTAQMENGRMTVWSSTQTPFPLKNAVAGAVGLPPENVRVLPPFVGGGFGGKSTNEEALEAARLAKLTGKPIQVCYSRAEEFFCDAFGPAAVIRIASGIDGSGNVVFWEYTSYHAGERNTEAIYDIPHHLTTTIGSWMMPEKGAHAFAVGAWRAPGAGINGFARDLHFNLMAEKAGIDPLEFRLRHLTDGRMKGVLRAAAEKIGWQPHTGPSGRGLGIACGLDANTYVAHMAEVEVDKKSGKVRLKKVVCAQDMGLCVNPQGATIQMEGAMTMGMGYALSEEVRFKGGKILDRNFGTYEIPRFSWLPVIETIIIDNMDKPAQGGGEPALVGMAAAIATGIHDATGARVFRLPMTPPRVKEALGRV